ncbi:hexosaminidase D-like [Galleria mellonella]|uniref:beta-N-acetylhexosaminidase n=1 Tax=Galleria mellonella TaxID=7137 RepID=A0ABM3MES0_GALME|nr:hexosaminidase D-like [Galleria mellonella]
MQRIVHLDLKGAPLKIPYLEQVLLNAKSWGATGILIEWEDTFPYSGELIDIGSLTNCNRDNMYSLQEVIYILKFAKETGLDVIQLIQTIGHMEFVLKHPAFERFREVPLSPSVLCPSKPGAQSLVQMMLDQALQVQPDAKYLHIGADEAWHLAECMDCQIAIQTKECKIRESLYLEHIQSVALFLKQKRPDLTVLIWDDMLRPVNFEILKSYKLGELVQPVVWDYNTVEYFRLDPLMWSMYAQLFPQVWAASAYKGASGSNKMVAPVSRYVSNHEAWSKELETYSSTVNFGGIFLTGWSRYDHYATLCELLPISLPSLACCLKVLCKTNDLSNELLVNEMLPVEQWPGEQLAFLIRLFDSLRERCRLYLSDSMLETWMNSWQLEHNYINPVKLQEVAFKTNILLTEIVQIKNDLTAHLMNVTGQRTVQEWIETNVTPVANELAKLLSVAQQRCTANASVRPT